MITIRNLRNLAIVSASLVGVLGFAETASAATWWQTHPRRVEVNHRLYVQRDRIAWAEANGEMSPGKAAYLLHKDWQLRREERVMASLNHGHITWAEQRALNQQENQVRAKIP